LNIKRPKEASDDEAIATTHNTEIEQSGNLPSCLCGHKVYIIRCVYPTEELAVAYLRWVFPSTPIHTMMVHQVIALRNGMV
jgi:hypothetical protein